MPWKCKKSSPDVDNSNPTKYRARAGQTSKTATPNTNVSKSGASETVNISQPIAQCQPHTPQQYILPRAFQFRQFVGNVTPINSCSPTIMQQPILAGSSTKWRKKIKRISFFSNKYIFKKCVWQSINTMFLA